MFHFVLRQTVKERNQRCTMTDSCLRTPAVHHLSWTVFKKLSLNAYCIYSFRDYKVNVYKKVATKVTIAASNWNHVRHTQPYTGLFFQ